MSWLRVCVNRETRFLTVIGVKWYEKAVFGSLVRFCLCKITFVSLFLTTNFYSPMKPRSALKCILVIGLAGLTFSGYLSYQELFATCNASCPIVKTPGSLLTLPACVYGFFMYLLVVIIASFGLKKQPAHHERK